MLCKLKVPTQIHLIHYSNQILTLGILLVWKSVYYLLFWGFLCELCENSVGHLKLTRESVLLSHRAIIMEAMDLWCPAAMWCHCWTLVLCSFHPEAGWWCGPAGNQGDSDACTWYIVIQQAWAILWVEAGWGLSTWLCNFMHGSQGTWSLPGHQLVLGCHGQNLFWYPVPRGCRTAACFFSKPS